MRMCLRTTLTACLLASGLHAQTAERKVVLRRAPEYPAILKARLMGGTVRLEVVITPGGVVRTVNTLGGNPTLAEAAEEAVRQWKFSAGPRETKTVVTIRFDPLR